MLRLSTSSGDIVIRLRHDVAPATCQFISKLVADGLYKDSVFYRGEPGFVLQGGLRKANGRSATPSAPNPPLEYNLPNKRGTVTMARWEDPNSGTGEFFINLKDSPHLDRTSSVGWGLGFAVFGEVVSGLEIAEHLANQPSTSSNGMRMLNTPVVFNATVQ